MSRFVKVSIASLLTLAVLIWLSRSVAIHKWRSPGPAIVNHENLFVRLFPYKNGWGYEITNAEQVFIRQPFVPVTAGRNPFGSQHDALEAGQLVLQKIKQGRPPALSDAELDSLNIKK